MSELSSQDLRRTLAGEFPQRMADVMGEYARFAANACPDDAKGCAAHHAACKAALQHLDLLAKLLRWAEAGIAPSAQGDAAAALLAQARTALDPWDEEDGEEEDD